MPPRKRKKCAARRTEVIDEPERVEGVNMMEDEGGEANQSHTPQESPGTVQGETSKDKTPPPPPFPIGRRIDFRIRSSSTRAVQQGTPRVLEEWAEECTVARSF